MGAEGQGGKARIVLLAALLLAVVAGEVTAADRPPLREAEDVYLAGRALTACATAELRPFAVPGRGLDDLPATLEEIIVEAREETSSLADAADGLAGGLLPATDRSVSAVRDAIRAQEALYEAMVTDPTGSEDELRALGRANNRAEARLDAARGWLLAGEPDGWDRRFTCRGQASSASSSK